MNTIAFWLLFVEPSLKRFLLLKNLWKDLQCTISSQSPCKRINLDIDEQVADPERAGESAAIHNLHMTSGSVAARYNITQQPSASSSQLLLSMDAPSQPHTLHVLPPNAKETADSPSSLDATTAMELSPPSTVIDSPTELVDMVPCYDNMDFQSLVQCSMDQYGNAKTGSVEELDSIMQVLVSM